MIPRSQDPFTVLVNSLAQGDEAGFRPARMADPPGWLGHAPFARWLVRVAAPRLMVELGVHSGNSYCALVQSVAELGLAATCLGVDTWQGDAQAGFYDETVLADLRAHHDPLYGRFSRLVRSRFDQTLPQVADASVDILHIDGCHAYDAVSRDFATWLPKMSPRGVVLLHDVCETREGFGVDRFWGELRAVHAGFVFPHSHGLGVLLTGQAPPPALAALAALDDTPEGDWTRVHFARLGQAVIQDFELKRRADELQSLSAECAALSSELERERKRREELDQSLHRSYRDFEAVRTERNQATCDLHEARDTGRALQADLARLGRELAESDRQALTFRQYLEESSMRARSLLAERWNLTRDLGDAKAREQALRLERERADRLGEERLHALNFAQAQARELRADSARLKAQVEAYRGSLSWRVTAPLRGLGGVMRLTPRRAKLERQAGTLRESGLFDQSFYLAQNPDVAASGQDPALHYLRHGWREGRAPFPAFDQGFYLRRHPEARHSRLSPLEHYLAHDKTPGHDPNPLFDTAFYLGQNPDVAEAGVNPLVHYLNHGAREGRDPHPGFVTRFVLLSDPELARSDENPLVHHLRQRSSRPTAPAPCRLTELSRPTPAALDWQRRMGPHLRPRIAFAVFLDARGQRLAQAVEAAESVLAQTYPFWRLALLVSPEASGDLPPILASDPRVDIERADPSALSVTIILARTTESARTDGGPAPQASDGSKEWKGQGPDESAGSGQDANCCVTTWAVCLSPNRRLEPHALFELARAAASKPSLEFLTADDLVEGADGRFVVRLKYGLPPLPDALTVPVDECLALSGKALAQGGGCPWLDGPQGARELLAGLDLKSGRAASLPLILSRIADSVTNEAEPASPFVDPTVPLANLATSLAKTAASTVELTAPPSEQVTPLARTTAPFVDSVAPQAEAAMPLAQTVMPIALAAARPVDPATTTSPRPAFHLASVIIPTAGKNLSDNLAPCLASLYARQAGLAFEVVVVDNSPHGIDPKELADMVPAGAWLKVVRDDGPFNFPRLMNAGARACTGSLLVSLNDDVEAASDGWLAALAKLAAIPGCAVAGAKLLYPGGGVQHAGMFHTRQGFRHAFRHSPGDASLNPLLGLARRVSAVTFACAAVPRKVWDRLNGLDPDYGVECNDTDFCLRAAQAGLFAAWTPRAVLVHKESASRRGLPVSKDRARLLDAWAAVLSRPDPYHHRHLSPSASRPRATCAPVLTERHAPDLCAEDAANLGLHVLPAAPDPQTILAMDLGHLGDLVLALPALAVLRQTFPQARLTVACSPANLGLARRLCDADEVVAQPLFHVRSEEGLLPGHGPDHEPALADGLSGRGFDLAVDLRRHPESRPLLARVEAGRRVGFATGAPDPALDVALPLIDGVADRAGVEYKIHAAAQKFALALACAPPGKRSALVVDDFLPTLVPRLDRGQALARFALPSGPPLVGLHPGSGSSMRRWPENNWAELADCLVREINAHVLLLGAPDEAELAGRVLALCSRPDRVSNLSGSLSLDDFCDLLPHLEAFVGNNSGPCHLAGMAGVATVTPWSGQVSAREWLAMGPRTQCVRTATPCAPCYRSLAEQCPFDRLCLRLVSPAAVFEALQGLLVFDNPARPTATPVASTTDPDPIPRAEFDAEAYLEANPDVAVSGVDPLTHYRLHGLSEGRPLRPALACEAPAPFGVPVHASGANQYALHASQTTNGFFSDPKAFSARLSGFARNPLVCVISHDASRTGAPLIALEILKRLANGSGANVCALLLGPGELSSEFAEAAPTLNLSTSGVPGEPRRTLAMAFHGARPDLCLANTVASARCALALCDLGLPVLSLVHEMPDSIENLAGREVFAELARRSRPMVLPSMAAASAIADHFALDAKRFPVARSGSFRGLPSTEAAAQDRQRTRRELGLDESDFLVLGCASLDLRKGADLFARLPALSRSVCPLRFVWVGDDAPPLARWLRRDAKAQGVSDRLCFVGAVADPSPYLLAADALALTSREDPFPLVVLEAMRAGLPVVAFEGAGGAPEALADCGVTVPFLDVAAMAQALDRLADDPVQAARLGERSSRRAAVHFTFDRYMADLIAIVTEYHGLRLCR